MCATGRLLAASIAAIRPLHHLERRRSRPADVALEAAAPRPRWPPHDPHRHALPSSRTRPDFRRPRSTCQRLSRLSAPQLPVVAMIKPAASKSPGSPCTSHSKLASRPTTRRWGKSACSLSAKAHRLVAANCRGTQRMPSDIWPTQDIRINQNDPARARLY